MHWPKFYIYTCPGAQLPGTALSCVICHNSCNWTQRNSHYWTQQCWANKLKRQLTCSRSLVCWIHSWAPLVMEMDCRHCTAESVVHHKLSPTSLFFVFCHCTFSLFSRRHLILCPVCMKTTKVELVLLSWTLHGAINLGAAAVWVQELNYSIKHVIRLSNPYPTTKKGRFFSY